MAKMRNITINIPEIYDKNIQKLIELKLIPSRSEAIRTAIREFLNKEYNKNLELLGYFEFEDTIPSESEKITNYQEYYMKKTMEAIEKLKENNVFVVNVKRIRRVLKVRSSNRSEINFYWRSLQQLEKEGKLVKENSTGPEDYRIVIEEKPHGISTVETAELDKNKKQNAGSIPARETLTENDMPKITVKELNRLLAGGL